MRKLPPFLFHYIDGGAHAESALAHNVLDLDAVRLRQRVMQDVSGIDPSVELFGQRQALPIALGPIGLAGMYARRGEVQAARAAKAAGIPFCLSTVSVCPLPEVARSGSDPLWFQLYMVRDRGFMREMLDQVVKAGCAALVFTVDMPVAATRYRDIRTGLSASSGSYHRARRVVQAMARPRWAWDVGLKGRPHDLGNVAPMLAGRSGLEDFFAWVSKNFDPSVTWKDLEFIRDHWKGPLLIKGILDVEDAQNAVSLGADGIVVSNHGGRQLDAALSPARALPLVADAVGDKLTVLADGGVRSGLDVLRMLALGAKGVLLGRSWAYALGASGERGVTRLLQLIEAELRTGMALAGVSATDQIDRSLIA